VLTSALLTLVVVPVVWSYFVRPPGVALRPMASPVA
jgi:hypothetical protein